MTRAAAPPSATYRLGAVENTAQLAKTLGVPLGLFRAVLRNKMPEDLYFRHEIPKKNPRFEGQTRIAWEASSEMLARAHKAVARRLDSFLRSKNIGYPHPAAHGYVRGGSTRSNAEPHCGSRLLVRADIQEFFPSITTRRIARILRLLGLHQKPARELAKFTTIEGTLPLGLPESPVISNLIALEMDREFQDFAMKRNLRYTRYADDITFSGSTNLPTKTELRNLLRHHKFALSERKFRLSKRGQAHFVTGLSVAENDYPHAPREMKRQLRQELYYCRKFGLAAHAARKSESPQKMFNRLYGLVSYVSFIERRHATTLRNQWCQIVKDEGREIAFMTTPGQDRRDVQVVVDESEFEVGGERFLALCFVRTDDLDKIERGIRGVQLSYLTTPGSKGDLELLEEVGVHFVDAHFDLRTQTFYALMELPWTASIQYKRIKSDKDYEATWLDLFEGAIRQEIVTADGAILSISVEQNNKVSQCKLIGIASKAFASAENADSRRPIELPKVQRVNKKNSPAVTLPDFVLAAFRHNAVRSADDRVLDFERVRDRVRYIRDVDMGHFYTRKNPFVDVENFSKVTTGLDRPTLTQP